MVVGIAIAVLLVALVLIGLLARKRIGDSDNAPAEFDELTVVPLPNRRGEALAVGPDSAIQMLEAKGLATPIPNGAGGTVAKALSKGIGLVRLASTDQARSKISSGQLVEIADESLRELKKYGATFDVSGNQLPLVHGKKGIQHLVRFRPPSTLDAAMASNLATLAMGVAIAQQLGNIEQQLENLQRTLDGLVADTRRERVSKGAAVNAQLEAIAGRIRRHGEMTDEDRHDLGSISLAAIQGQIEAEMRFDEMLGGSPSDLNRDRRRKAVEKLLDDEGLEHWLQSRVLSELARNRYDLLMFYWEQSRHPGTIDGVAEETLSRIEGRQTRLARVRTLLLDLVDPGARKHLDRLRYFDGKALAKKELEIEGILEKHSGAFFGPGGDSYAIELASDSVPPPRLTR